MHLVSVWAVEANLTLGQVATNEKSNAIEAIPRLLELLDVQGALVSIDAMGCQKAIAAKIVAGGGDYILTVKDNQEQTLATIQPRLPLTVAFGGRYLGGEAARRDGRRCPWMNPIRRSLCR